MDELLLFTVTSPSLHFKTDGLLLTILIDELSPQHRWTSSYYLQLTSPSLHFKTDGLLLTILIDELSPQHRWTSSYYLQLTSPSPHFKQMGSFLQFLLTSSPLNSDGRAPTIHSDEPFTAYQSDGLLFTISIDELSPQLRWMSSYYSQ